MARPLVCLADDNLEFHWPCQLLFVLAMLFGWMAVDAGLRNGQDVAGGFSHAAHRRVGVGHDHIVGRLCVLRSHYISSF